MEIRVAFFLRPYRALVVCAFRTWASELRSSTRANISRPFRPKSIGSFKPLHDGSFLQIAFTLLGTHAAFSLVRLSVTVKIFQ